MLHRFRAARRDPNWAILEGFHALKHALRFGAEVVEIVITDPVELAELVAELSPDLSGHLEGRYQVVDRQLFDQLSPTPPPTGVIARAVRPRPDIDQLLSAEGDAPIVFLEAPSNIPNIGAAIRVAAAADAGGVLTTGIHDPWHPHAIRGGAGLQFALPVARLDALPSTDRPVLALDPGGERLRPGMIPPGAILAFGTERGGLSAEVLERAAMRISIPMKAGVSSLNLATAVAVVLYSAYGLGGDRRVMDRG